jgi:hypothetical protein
VKRLASTAAPSPRTIARMSDPPTSPNSGWFPQDV